MIPSRALPILDRNLAVVLFRCVRELIYNVAKHATASVGRIELEAVDNAVWLVVSDNGQGFSPAAATRQPGVGGGYGLFGVRERLALLGGDLTIESDAGGARVSLRVPLVASAHAPPTLEEKLEVRAS
ncbi:MAG: ATP-binding protein [Candidatus Contendobacter sp.]|nr:ATP-binding protein [Candidatus Contendobacter sp.]